ncbi:hypothetical protein OEA41_009233 [Lepraria neglecta]|uniref:Uncharacterized protein n=1 Tax=Lepraria neglecta TaxID=209136 RepID=A0AAD9Z1K4_9LECA|nr:hypothetical protein OEA41_009233 [Lepraria neglecta]
MVLGSLYTEVPQFYALFCTAQIPAQMINGLLKASDDHYRANNVWTLIRNHDQSVPKSPPNTQSKAGTSAHPS